MHRPPEDHCTDRAGRSTARSGARACLPATAATLPSRPPDDGSNSLNALAGRIALLALIAATTAACGDRDAATNTAAATSPSERPVAVETTYAMAIDSPPVPPVEPVEAAASRFAAALESGDATVLVGVFSVTGLAQAMALQQTLAAEEEPSSASPVIRDARVLSAIADDRAGASVIAVMTEDGASLLNLAWEADARGAWKITSITVRPGSE